MFAVCSLLIDLHFLVSLTSIRPLFILVRFVYRFFILFSIGHLVFILFLYLAVFVEFLTVLSIFIFTW